MPFARLLWIQQIVVAQLARREAIHRFDFTENLGQRADEQSYCGKPLLTVNDEQR